MGAAHSLQMRAARYQTVGPTRGELSVVELERPEPSPGEVRVRMRVSGVNPTDWKARLNPQGTAAGFDEVIPNQDGAGEIDAVGDGVDPRRIGERVWVYNAQWRRAHGTAAQWVALPAEQVVPLPTGVSFDLGAGLGIPAMTAHRCLFEDGPLEGTRVLVHGGAGAVGHAAIELARWSGARVAATVSSGEKAQLAHAAGAELVVNYRSEDVVAAIRSFAPAGMQRIVEVDISSNLELDAAVLTGGGVISSYGLPKAPFFPPRSLYSANATLHFVLVYSIPEQAKRQATTDITAALCAGALTRMPVLRFPLNEIAAAHNAVKRNAVGKVLVDIP